MNSSEAIEAVRLLSPTGMLGTGFSQTSFRTALESGVDGIGCDAGSADSGAYFLGTGVVSRSDEALKRDLRLMLKGALDLHVPLIVGSAISAGGDAQLGEAIRMVREIADEEGLSFQLAVIHAEVDREWFLKAWQKGRVRALPSVPELTEEAIQNSAHLVAQMGAEPFIQALNAGADVILAGRSSDAAIFAALAMSRGMPAGPSWHAAKIIECGAAAADQRLYPDCIVATIDQEGFAVEIPNPAMACSALSVRAHGYYENPSALQIGEPGGTIDMGRSTFTELTGGKVRVEGSAFLRSEHYEVRVEGSRLAGYRAISFGGISDPILLDNLPLFLDSCRKTIFDKVSASLGAQHPADYNLVLRQYGSSRGPRENGMSHQVGLLVDVTAKSQEQARAIGMVAYHTLLHHPVPGWHGLVSNLAIPFSPAVIEAGPVYAWSVNHLVELNDPAEIFPMVGPRIIGRETIYAPW